MPPRGSFCLNCGAATVPALREPARAFANPSARIKAFLIDKLFVGSLVMLGIVVGGVLSPVAIALAAVLPWLYYAGFDSAASWQGTPGKALSGLKVVRTGGERLSFARASLRYLVKMISLAIWVGAIVSLALIAFTDRQQTLHDRFVDSWVVPK
ncbi:MAG: RDD family protein [Bryobacterales bacterium]|nr:RDD family protein [Bryobacterales bacterium]